MRTQLRIIALIATLVVSVSTSAQLHFGLKAGTGLTQVKLEKETLTDANNRLGWFAGIMVEYSMPISGLGIDASVLYNNKEIELETERGKERETLKYVDVPINLKLTIGLGSTAGVFLTTGPQFSYNIGDDDLFSDLSLPTANSQIQNISRRFELKKSEFSWNVGAGVKLMKHIQIAYNYNMAIGSTADVNVDLSTITGIANDAANGKLKNNTHQVSVALVF